MKKEEIIKDLKKFISKKNIYFNAGLEKEKREKIPNQTGVIYRILKRKINEYQNDKENY